MNNMNQLIVVNKPINYTSRDVVNKLSHILNYKKIGHTGTLDPLATGVLVCVCGKYTKLVDLITSLDKEYVATIRLGIKTDTLDITGGILEEQEVSLSLEKISKAIAEFPKSYNQEVPKYSAVKINGKKLYEYARENIDISLPKRLVHIYSLELINYQDNLITIKAHVSKGTFIRSLIRDLCKNLNTIGTMESLVRTKQGQFCDTEAYSLDDIACGNYKSLNIKEFLPYPVREVDSDIYKKVANGARIMDTYHIEDKIIFTYEGQDIAIYEKKDDLLKPFLILV